ncbi:MAG: hypothetical protein HKN09_03150 [Saprospiraceae bacterium]|nr:hypothetical protein [Saprospiraceae bacterium]
MRGAFLYLTFISLLCGAWVNSYSNSKRDLNAVPQETDITPEEAFDLMMKVLMSPRCLNCHPSGDRPTQGDDLHIHYYNVQRGPNNRGAGIQQCQSCHQNSNNYYTGVPGASNWHLAPKSMGWQGLTKIEIAKIILDQSKNGGIGLDSLVTHLTNDSKVLWAFDPGINQEGVPRSLPPVAKETYIEAVKIWAENGAPIPNDD